MSNQGQPPDKCGNTSIQGFLFPNLNQDAERCANEVGSNKPSKRKLQLSNGYLLEFDHLSRLLKAVWDNRDRKKISRSILVEDTGLPDSHVESLVSMGSAMDLIKPIVQIATRFGVLVATHDIFFERLGTLEWCHYRGAGSQRNLIWFDVFNRLLPNEEPMTHPEWNAWFRKELEGQYSERTIRKVVQEEVHFVIDAYLEQRLGQLDILEKADNEALRVQRHLQLDHVMLSAMLYDFIENHDGTTFALEDLARIPGSPTRVFGIDTESLRGLVEVLHNNSWLRYETTHNLDQIRLRSGYSSIEFLTAYYEQHEPRPKDQDGGGHG